MHTEKEVSRYEILTKGTDLSMPRGSEILGLEVRYSEPVTQSGEKNRVLMSTLADPKEPREIRHFVLMDARGPLYFNTEYHYDNRDMIQTDWGTFLLFEYWEKEKLKKLKPNLGFHTKDGLYFNGFPNGSVHIVKRATGVPGAPVVWDINLDPGTWASVVASVSARGADADTFRAAKTFHEITQEQWLREGLLVDRRPFVDQTDLETVASGEASTSNDAGKRCLARHG